MSATRFVKTQEEKSGDHLGDLVAPIVGTVLDVATEQLLRRLVWHTISDERIIADQAMWWSMRRYAS